MDKQARSLLRQRLRARRQALSYQQQQTAARSITRIIKQTGLFKRHQDIAFYLANDGEIDPHILLKHACQQGRHCYLPVLTSGNSLWFVRYRPGDKLKKNRFGIPEPDKHQPRRKSWALGLVFLPLVGFDRRGGRLGMGGGFYDRSFNGIKRSPAMTQPHLVGLAHHCQEIATLTLESWDIPLKSIVTDKEIIHVK